MHETIDACMEYKNFTPNDLIISHSSRDIKRFQNLPCKAIAFSTNGGLEEIPRCMYRKLHDADKAKFNQLHLCLNDSDDDLALAINDRIRRACAQKT